MRYCINKTSSSTSIVVSIITPTFNSAKYIKETIDSVISQTFESWEMILVDDGSSDNTILIIDVYRKIYPQIKYYSRHRGPKSASTCRNIGAVHAIGKYLLFLDSDDILLPNCLKRRVEIMNHHAGLPFAVFPTATFVKSHNKVSLTCLNKAKENYFYEFISSSAPWQTSGPIWKRDFFFEIGGFDESYQRLQDVEFTTKALLKAGNQYYIYNGKDYDYLYRISYRKREQEFIKMLQLSYSLYYEWVKTLEKKVENKRKYEISRLSLLIAQSYSEFMYPDKEGIKRLISNLGKSIGSDFSRFDYWIFKFSTYKIGYYPIYVWRAYLIAKYHQRIHDLPNQYFIIWITTKLISRYRKNNPWKKI